MPVNFPPNKFFGREPSPDYEPQGEALGLEPIPENLLDPGTGPNPVPEQKEYSPLVALERMVAEISEHDQPRMAALPVPAIPKLDVIPEKVVLVFYSFLFQIADDYRCL
jgi:hypothetical protein